MKTRILAGLCMVPLLVFVILGGWWLMAVIIAASAIGITEFYKGFEKAGITPSRYIGYAMLIVLYAFHACTVTDVMNTGTAITIWLALAVMASMVYGFSIKKRNLMDMPATLMGIVYVEFLFYQVILVDQSKLPQMIWIILLAAFGTDICAYFAGYFLGKHKLCPDLSPKKTIEGAVGGTIGAMILCALFGLIFFRAYMGLCILCGFAGSVASQLGDLSASAFKRQMGIKDYGKLIPGHGGILDRFDSVLFVAPVVYCIINLAA